MWVLIRKDLLRRWRSPLATIVMIVFPLFMSAAIGSLGGSGGEATFPRITVLVQNLDAKGFIANALVGGLNNERAQEYLDVVVLEADAPARQMMENGEASALLILPADFTRKIMQREPVALEVVRNPSEGIKPEIIVQGARLVATYLDKGARLLSKELGVLNTMLEADQIPDSAKVGALAAEVMSQAKGVEDYLFPPLVTIGSVKEADAAAGAGGGPTGIFGYVLIMTAVMALLFVAIRSVGDIHDERNSGMLHRLLATPVSLGLVIEAKVVFGVLFGLIVLLILGVIGLLLNWIVPPANPAAVLVLGLAFSLAACGVMALLTSLVRNEKQAGIMSWLVIMGMSALGGSMLPVNQMPAPLQAAAPFTINYWAIDGFTRLIMSGDGFGDIVHHLAVLVAVGIATGAAAHVLMVRRFREMRP